MFIGESTTDVATIDDNGYSGKQSLIEGDFDKYSDRFGHGLVTINNVLRLMPTGSVESISDPQAGMLAAEGVWDAGTWQATELLFYDGTSWRTIQM